MFPSRLRTICCAAAIVALIAPLNGCGSRISGTATAGELDVRKLDVGRYAIDPLDLRYTYNPSLSYAKTLAVLRLADQVATGQEIEPQFKWSTGGIPITSTSDLDGGVLARDNIAVADKYGMLFGFAAGASDTEPDSRGHAQPGAAFMSMVVLQFPSEQAATQAATEIEQTDFRVAADQNEKVDIPKFPDAHTHWRPTVANIGSTMAHGRYVINLFMGLASVDLNAMKYLVERAYSTQIPLLDNLPPLTPEDMARLPYDPDGLLNRTLNPDAYGIPDYQYQAVFGVRGFLHRVADNARLRKVLTDAGVDRGSMTRAPTRESAVVFRTRDDDAARVLEPELLAAQYATAADAPHDIPGTKCGENKLADLNAKRFRCALSYRRYAAFVEGDQLQDVQQRAAAQYALLADAQ